VTQQDDGTPTVVEVETERVDGVVDLAEIVRRVQEHVADRTAQMSPGTEDDPELRQRLTRVGELAGQLAQELSALPPEALGQEPTRPG
jgi:hypothetical protein